MTVPKNFKPHPTDNTMIYFDGNAHPRYVAAVANMAEDGTIFLGIRHFCPLMRQNIEAWEKANDVLVDKRSAMQQGFVDQHGTFMDRREAMKIAVARCQIRKSIGYDSALLYSEHLH